MFAEGMPFSQYTLAMPQTSVQVVLLLRTYAFTGAKKIVLVSLSVCLSGDGIYQLFGGLLGAVSTCNSLVHPIDRSHLVQFTQ